MFYKNILIPVLLFVFISTKCMNFEDKKISLEKDKLNKQLFGIIGFDKDKDLPDIIDLIQKGADINCLDEEGYTPLMRASYWGMIHTVRVLVWLGADINVKKGNDSALEFAKG